MENISASVITRVEESRRSFQEENQGHYGSIVVAIYQRYQRSIDILLIENVSKIFLLFLYRRKWSTMKCRIYHTCITKILLSGIYISIPSDQNHLVEVLKVKNDLGKILCFCPVYLKVHWHISFHSNPLALVLSQSHTAQYSDNVFGVELWGVASTLAWEIFTMSFCESIIPCWNTIVEKSEKISTNTDMLIQIH